MNNELNLQIIDLLWDETEHLDIFKKMIKDGLPIDYILEPDLGDTLIMSFCDYDRIGYVKYLLDAGASLKAENVEGNTLLQHAASFSASIDILKEILTADIFIDHQNKLGQTSLMLSAKDQQKNKMKLLLSRGANPYLKDINNANILHYYCMLANENPLDVRQEMDLLKIDERLWTQRNSLNMLPMDYITIKNARL